MSRDQLLKAPRYIEPHPLAASNVVSRQSSDVTGDVIVHKVHQVESKLPIKAVDAATGAKSQQTGAQQRIAVTSGDQKQCVDCLLYTSDAADE